MNFKYSALVLVSALAVCMAGDDVAKAVSDRFDLMEKSICEGKDLSPKITDDQYKDVGAKCSCGADTEEKVNTLIKTCLNVKDLDPKTKLSVFCGDTKACMLKAWTGAMTQLKPDEFAAATQTFDKFIACVKGITKL